jgi:2-methylaconitate cis-trans-isomerase PrpF
VQQRAIPAVFMRGGTSKGLFFRADQLPAEPAARDRLFLAALGSPDPYGRQLDGMGGGISSLSKVMVVEHSARPGVDLDYTFGQVAVDRPLVDYAGNCGNLTAAVGPFAIACGLLRPSGSAARLALFNTNTGKRVVASFALDEAGQAAVRGDYELPGVAGSGAPIRLDFQDPGGAVTGRLLPGGQPRETLLVPGVGPLEVSIVDASAAVVFVRARDLGAGGSETPAELTGRPELLRRLEQIRLSGAVRAGLARDLAEAAERCRAMPKIALVAPAGESRLLDGRTQPAAAVDLLLRMISMGQAHNALPLTGACCAAVAARIEGTLVAEALAAPAGGATLRLGHPSGTLEVDATVEREPAWVARAATAFRTARILMSGSVMVPPAPESQR